MERRKFIKQCGALCLGSTAAALLLQSCKALFYAPHTFGGNTLTIKKSDFAQHSYALVRNDRLPAPLYVLKLTETSYSAVLMLCTHKSCELNLGGGFLICPCHGSEFSGTGKVQNPPADKDLQAYPVSTDAENIYITL